MEQLPDMKAFPMNISLESDQVASPAVQVTSPVPREAWKAVQQADPYALVTQSPAWIDYMVSFGPFEDASRFYAYEDGQCIVLPMVRRRLLRGVFSFASSFQNSWGMGGLIASKPLLREHVQTVISDLSKQKDVHVMIRPDPLKGEVWSEAAAQRLIAVPRLAHVLDLQGGFSNIWEKKFKSTTRTAIRKAEKSGLVVERDTTGRLVPVFYELFKQSLDRWGQHQHEPLALARLRGHQRDPLSKFERMAAYLGEACQFWVAWYQQQPAAAILVLQGANCSYTRGAMNKELAGPTRANDLLHRLAIEAACQAGCHYYHMGESGASTSLAAFKKGFGADPVPYAEYHLERFPITKVDQGLRRVIKTLIGFKDA
ncbi:MAG: GNAT family N-acetyltransferase [Anaerolineaceae bacterium]|nr:GNAT family N-acetyltransferase [Anaerolineaceae bacterium]